MRWEENQVVVKVDRPGDYDNIGIMLFHNKESNLFGISRFSHCSCDGTWTSTNTDPADWEGGIDELITIARNLEDLGFRGRALDETDYEYSWHKRFYELVLEWVLSGFTGTRIESIS